MMIAVTQNRVAEWSFASSKAYDDPFNEVELSFVFEDEQGASQTVPAFWGGGDIWRVRFSTPRLGKFHYRSLCSDEDCVGLHGLEGEFQVVPYSGDNPLYQHGPMTISEDKTYFQHADGTPFFWLGDTWWMGLCDRIDWPGFRWLCDERAAKGFSVGQIVAGLYPDMPPFDDRGRNEAGFPWEADYARVNPAYFDMADRRFECMIDSGIVPCIVGCWGYFLDFMGVEKVKKHWRYLIARYGAYPVMWCAAGESKMPYYLHPLFSKRDEYESAIVPGWTEVTSYIRSLDPFRRPLTIHGIYERTSRSEISDPSLLDFDFIQAGATGAPVFPGAMRILKEGMEMEPKMPEFFGEVVYEGIFGGSHDEIQRLFFWSSILSGAKAHTYGANGLWQANNPDRPHGASPYGMSYDGPAWYDAAKLPGSACLGAGKKLLERFEWWNFEPHPEWIELLPSPLLDGFYNPNVLHYFVPRVAGIPGKVRIAYISHFLFTNWPRAILGLENDTDYRAYFFDSVTAKEYSLGNVNADENGRWEVPGVPVGRDLLLVLESI